jgi:hypothetical protein
LGVEPVMDSEIVARRAEEMADMGQPCVSSHQARGGGHREWAAGVYRPLASDQAHRLLRPLCKNASSVSAIKNRIVASGREKLPAERSNIGAVCRM